MIDAAELKQTMLLAMSEHHSGNAEEAGRIVDAILAAIEAAGVRLVPVEATPTMAYVGTDARWQSAVRDANNVREIWRAMLAASPYAPQKDESHD